MTAPDAWLTKQQAADRLQVHVRTVERFVRTKKLAQYRINKTVRYRPEDVDALLTRDSPEPEQLTD